MSPKKFCAFSRERCESGLNRLFQEPFNHIAAHEFFVQPRINLVARDEVEAGDLTVVQHQQPLLAWLAGELGQTFLELFLVGFEHIAHGRGGGRHAGLDLELGHLVPDFPPWSEWYVAPSLSEADTELDLRARDLAAMMSGEDEKWAVL